MLNNNRYILPVEFYCDLFYFKAIYIHTRIIIAVYSFIIAYTLHN